MQISILSDQALALLPLPFLIDSTYFGLEARDASGQLGLLVGQLADDQLSVIHLTYRQTVPQIGVALLKSVQSYGAMERARSITYAYEAKDLETKQRCDALLQMASWPAPKKSHLTLEVSKSKAPLHQRGTLEADSCQVMPLHKIPWRVRFQFLNDHRGEWDFTQYGVLEPAMSLALVDGDAILGYCLFQNTHGQPELVKTMWPSDKGQIVRLATAISQAFLQMPHATALLHLYTPLGETVCKKLFGGQIVQAYDTMVSQILLGKDDNL